MANKKVLVVDDDSDWASILSAFIEKFGGIQPTVCGSGKEALDILSTESFDAVLTDTNMPLMNGIELLQEIRKRHPELKVVVFFHELYGSDIQKEDVLNLGASAVLKKDTVLGLLPVILAKITY